MFVESLGFADFFGVGGDVAIGDGLAFFCAKAVFAKLGVDCVVFDAFFVNFYQFRNVNFPACLPAIFGHIGVEVNADTVGLILSEIFGNHFERAARVSAETDFAGDVWCDIV